MILTLFPIEPEDCPPPKLELPKPELGADVPKPELEADVPKPDVPNPDVPNPELLEEVPKPPDVPNPELDPPRLPVSLSSICTRRELP